MCATNEGDFHLVGGTKTHNPHVCRPPPLGAQKLDIRFTVLGNSHLVLSNYVCPPPRGKRLLKRKWLCGNLNNLGMFEGARNPEENELWTVVVMFRDSTPPKTAAAAHCPRRARGAWREGRGGPGGPLSKRWWGRKVKKTSHLG